jgi:hypothetical protein
MYPVRSYYITLKAEAEQAAANVGVVACDGGRIEMHDTYHQEESSLSTTPYEETADTWTLETTAPAEPKVYVSRSMMSRLQMRVEHTSSSMNGAVDLARTARPIKKARVRRR